MNQTIKDLIKKIETESCNLRNDLEELVSELESQEFSNVQLPDGLTYADYEIQSWADQVSEIEQAFFKD